MNCKLSSKPPRLVSGTGDDIRGRDLELGNWESEAGVFWRDTKSTSGIGWRAGSLEPEGNLHGTLKLTGATL